MSAWPSRLALVLALACAAAAHAAREGKGEVTYRWVDEKGVVHYGDRVPPEYAQKESTVLNSRGVEIDRREAPKTPEQLAEEARRRQEMLRQKEHDSFLLTTYTSVNDIEALRDVRLDQLKGQLVAAEQYIASLEERLRALQTRAMMFAPYSSRDDARRMPDDLAEELVRTVKEVRTQRNTLAAKAEEETALRAQFQADIDRYKQLTTARATR